MVKTGRLPAFFVFVLLLTGMGSTMETFDWLATDSAPENYPMQIVTGDFILSNGGSLYIPNTRILHKGWGIMESSHVVGPELKPLPRKMEITFFSYVENAFYQGSFELPYDKIQKLFAAGYYSPKKKADTTYDYIMTGVAPGGAVAVWLFGADRITEVFYAKADRVDLDWSMVNENPAISREEEVRLTLEESIGADGIKKLETEPASFARWDRYRENYSWQPWVNSDTPPGLINSIAYFNGEFDYLRYPLDASLAELKRPVPKSVRFIWRNSKGKSYWVKYFFDENEIFAAFDKLASQGQAGLLLELKVEETPGGRTISSYLRNDDEAIKLEYTRLESPPTGLTNEEIDSL